MSKIKEALKKIEEIISKKEIDIKQIKILHIDFVKNKLKSQHCIDKYIGDFPTFIEPVHLGDKVELGDDVLIGPNVYIGDNCKISDFCEIINTIIFDNVILGENFKLENCIIAKDTELTFNNLKVFNSILKGQADSREKLIIVKF